MATKFTKDLAPLLELLESINRPMSPEELESPQGMEIAANLLREESGAFCYACPLGVAEALQEFSKTVHIFYDVQPESPSFAQHIFPHLVTEHHHEIRSNEDFTWEIIMHMLAQGKRMLADWEKMQKDGSLGSRH